jgi:alkylhydroperoxidase/carboxymuconolactone decarboxylase family protein YurZ
MRLGLDEAGVTELLAAAEHAQALAVVAAALLLDGLDSTRGLVELVDPLKARHEAAETLADIAAWARHALGVEGVPAVWRALAGNPLYLDATWQKERAVMADGRLTALDKRRISLAVAMNARVRYWIEYHAAVLRHAGGTDADLLEILGVVDHYTTLNTLSEAMQIESDIRPPA